MSKIGRIVRECWEGIPEHFSRATLDEFVIMPDHVHGIVVLSDVIGTQFVGTRLVGTQLVGTRLVGTQLVGTQLVGTQQAVSRREPAVSRQGCMVEQFGKPVAGSLSTI
ncbi:MAG TPA: hypothetical protein VMH23_19455, partial [Bacteroidota bacterium]|nr:hypothetical protein [Bacteroidota bacterium]